MPWSVPGDSGAVAATPIRVAFLNDDQTPAPLPVPRPSPCPGLLRIVQALDGGICRIKLDAGRLDAAQARAVAAAARDCASGVIEATNRSNLQLRGVRRGEEERLVRRLLDAGLGPRHGSLAGADDVRNLMLSPAAGLDPHLSLDVRPLAARLLLRLQADSRYHALSAKFAIQLDGGEDLAMLEHPHDIWLSPMPAAPTATLVFGLAGCPARDRPWRRCRRSGASPWCWRCSTCSSNAPSRNRRGCATCCRSWPENPCWRPCRRAWISLCGVTSGWRPGSVRRGVRGVISASSHNASRAW